MVKAMLRVSLRSLTALVRKLHLFRDRVLEVVVPCSLCSHVMQSAL